MEERFSTKEDCLSYLAELKWSDGYSCRKCGHVRYCYGIPQGSLHCTRCNYTAFPMVRTLYHMVKFNFVKVFYKVVYFISTNKKGITSTEFSRKLGLRQKTCWSFKIKVMKAMVSSGNHLITGTAEVKETVFGEQEESFRGRQNRSKKLVVVGIEKKKKGISRMYARVIPNVDASSFGAFMRDYKDLSANVTTDQRTGYGPLVKDFVNMVLTLPGKKGAIFTTSTGR